MTVELKTYQEVGVSAGLEGLTLKRFVGYMKERWAPEEDTQCKVGYAMEWAERFKYGDEYRASDLCGQAILRYMDEAIRLGRGGERYGF